MDPMYWGVLISISALVDLEVCQTVALETFAATVDAFAQVFEPESNGQAALAAPGSPAAPAAPAISSVVESAAMSDVQSPQAARHQATVGAAKGEFVQMKSQMSVAISEVGTQINDTRNQCDSINLQIVTKVSELDQKLAVLQETRGPAKELQYPQ